MLNLYHDRNGWDYDEFTIETNEGKFGITFAPNLDLYWYYNPKESVLDYSNTKEFVITKENEFIYSCFDKLCKSIETKKPYLNVLWDCSFKNKVDKYSNCPYESDSIKWRSDEHYIDDASSVSIKKEENIFRIIFEKSKGDEFPTFYVRFSNSGSRYNPYNVTFMGMYNELIEYFNKNKQNYEREKTKKLK